MLTVNNQNTFNLVLYLFRIWLNFHMDIRWYVRKLLMIFSTHIQLYFGSSNIKQYILSRCQLSYPTWIVWKPMPKDSTKILQGDYFLNTKTSRDIIREPCIVSFAWVNIQCILDISSHLFCFLMSFFSGY